MWSVLFPLWSCTSPDLPPDEPASRLRLLVAPVVVALPSPFLEAYARATELELLQRGDRVEVGPLVSLYEAEHLAELSDGQVERRDPFDELPLVQVPAPLQGYLPPDLTGMTMVRAWVLQGDRSVWRLGYGLSLGYGDAVIERVTVYLAHNEVVVLLERAGFPNSGYNRSEGCLLAPGGKFARVQGTSHGMGIKDEQLVVGDLAQGAVVELQGWNFLPSLGDPDGPFHREQIELIRLDSGLGVRRYCLQVRQPRSGGPAELVSSGSGGCAPSTSP